MFIRFNTNDVDFFVEDNPAWQYCRGGIKKIENYGYARDRVGFEHAAFPAFEPRHFGIEDLLPRDYKKFLNTKDKDTALRLCRALVLEWRVWNERYLPMLFGYAENAHNITEEDIKKGKYFVKMRISQFARSRMNEGILVTNQAQTMVKRLKRFGLIEFLGEGWNYHYNNNSTLDSFAKGYKVNLWGIFAWLGAIRDTILSPFATKFGQSAVLLTIGYEDIKRFTMRQRAQFLVTYWSEFFVHKDWHKFYDKTKINASQVLAMERDALNEHTYEILKEIKKLGKLECVPEEIRGTMLLAIGVKNMLKFYNINKDESTISPHVMNYRRKIKGDYSAPNVGRLTMRVSSDICSVPKRDGMYKGIEYLRREDMIAERMGWDVLYEYDTKNSIHADNYYLLTGEVLEGDLYGELIPPKLKAALLADKEWCQMVFDAYNDGVWVDGEIEEFVDRLTIKADRKHMKRLANVAFSVENKGGKLYNFMHRRFKPEKRNNIKVKAAVKRYAEHFNAVYTSIVGPSLGSFIYQVESWRMLHVANAVMNEGYGAVLIYDCLLTDKKMDEDQWQYLNTKALDELKIVGVDYFNAFKRKNKEALEKFLAGRAKK